MHGGLHEGILTEFENLPISGLHEDTLAEFQSRVTSLTRNCTTLGPYA